MKYNWGSMTIWWESLSNRHRRYIKWGSILVTTLSFFIVCIDYFWSIHPDCFNYEPHAKYVDHQASYFFFGIMATLGTIISFIVLLTVSSKEATSIAEYLDIFNDILEDVRDGESFFILSPAHNAGQKDAFNKDPIMIKKYELNQKLLIEKTKSAKGQYTLLEFKQTELSAFSDAAELTKRTEMIEKFEKNGAEYSLMFHFLMRFSKQISEAKKDEEIVQIQKYVNQAFLHLNSLILSNLEVKLIEKADYLDAPLAIIISERAAYFGLYKISERRAETVVRGIKVTDHQGIEMLKVLYFAISKQFSKDYQPIKSK